MSLPTAAFGTTGMQITRVGFGAWAIGGGDWAFSWGPQDDDDSVASIHRAVELGVNWIDTAAVYGLGHSERVVAKALADLPEAERPYVFTKCGLIWDDAERNTPSQRIGDPISLGFELEDSLFRLGVDRIDLYQMHWPAQDGTPLEEYWERMVKMRADGKVRAIGLSNHSLDELERAEAIGHVDSLQPPFSAIHREAADGLLQWCADHGTAVICYSPMQAGLLTGAFSAERVAGLPADDWRRGNPDFTDGLAANLQVADAMQAVAERRGTTAAAVSVAWTLAWPGLTGAIVGARNADQIDGWIGAATLELEEADLDQIAAAIEASGAGEGPTRP
jgi:aryl-alcohol dehydrogenase-like predicted oxidoreductase